jgi:hypothetical protein
MRRSTGFVADAGAALAIGLLLAVLAGRVLLLSSATPAPQANTLLASTDSSPQAPARLVLVVDRADAAGTARAVRRARSAYPDQGLDVHRVDWPPSGRHRSREAGSAALARMYGYSELPILLTVSREGQVVRVRSFPATESR